MNNFLVSNNHLSNLYQISYEQEIDIYENAVQEATCKARDIDFANVISVLPKIFLSTFIHSNELDNKIVEKHEFNYKLGGTIIDLIQETQLVVKEYIENKSKKSSEPTKITLTFKRHSSSTIPIKIPSEFVNCNNQEDIAKMLGKLIAFYDVKNIYLPYIERLQKSEKTFKPISFKKMQNFDNYKLQLNPKSSDDEIIWVYMNLLYEEQEEIGIYYALPDELINNARISKIIKKIESLKLAINTGCEFGNNNIYMKISERGDYLIENFNNLSDYRIHLEEEKSKNSIMNSYVTNNITGSKIENSNINQVRWFKKTAHFFA